MSYGYYSDKSLPMLNEGEKVIQIAVSDTMAYLLTNLGNVYQLEQTFSKGFKHKLIRSELKTDEQG